MQRLTVPDPGHDAGNAGLGEADDIVRGGSGGVARYSRRLSDKILIAFHHACDQSDFEVAEQLLRTLETLIVRRTAHVDTNRRRNQDSLVAAHERLWSLRHPDQEGN